MRKLREAEAASEEKLTTSSLKARSME
jgi:hypothetical protein